MQPPSMSMTLTKCKARISTDYNIDNSSIYDLNPSKGLVNKLLKKLTQESVNMTNIEMNELMN